SHDTPLDPTRAHYSANALKRMRDDMIPLLTAGMRAAAARAIDLLQPPARDERLALLEGVKQDLEQAQAEFAARGPHAVRADSRFACDALRLHRVCRRETCRKAQTCRGNPAGCSARAKVPQPVHEWIATLLLAERVPLLPLLSESRAA